VVFYLYNWTEVPMHIVKLIERYFPERKGKIVPVLVFLSISLLQLGLGLMFIQ
jgi:hypothetical protein